MHFANHTRALMSLEGRVMPHGSPVRGTLTGSVWPWQVNYSMMVGAILSWGIAWPLVRNRAGDWYPILPASTASYSFQGFAAYPIFWSLGLYLGDGGYQMLKMCAPPPSLTVLRGP